MFLGMDSMPTDLGQIYTAHLYMKSKQSLEVYDRMGNELIYDTEPRLCEEIVTFIFQRNQISIIFNPNRNYPDLTC